jgi:hypothetical protein
MKVSITEDATISRTRSEGGIAVVRVDAIAWLPAWPPGFWNLESETTALRRV